MSIDDCINEVVKKSKGAMTPDRARQLLYDFIDQNEKLKQQGTRLGLKDLTANEQYIKWLEKGVQQRRFNQYNDLIKRNDLYNKIDKSSLASAKKSLSDLMDNINETIKETKATRVNDFNYRLNEEGVAEVYHSRQFDQDKTALYVNRLMTKNTEAPSLKSIPAEDIAEFKIASVMADYFKKTNTLKNNLGANVGFLEGRIGRNTHNAHTLTVPSEAQAWKEWALQEGHVEWDRMDIGKGTKEEYLENMLGDIRSGIHSEDSIKIFELGDGKAVKELEQKQKVSGSLAFALGKQRKFMIAPEHWLEYQKRFGDGDLVTVFNNELMRDARSEAMLQVFGSAPEANLNSVISQLVEETKMWGSNKTHPLRQLAQDRFNYISGRLNDAAGGVSARIMRSTRLFMSTDKLGLSVFSSLGDFITPQLRQSLFLNEKNIVRNFQIGIDGLVNNFKKAVRLYGTDTAKAIYQGELARLNTLSLFMRNELRMMDEFAIDVNGRPNRTLLDKSLNFADDIHSKIGVTNFLEWYTNNRLASSYDSVAATLGSFADKSFTQLPDFMQKNLKELNLADIWDLMRKNVIQEGDMKFITPNALDNLLDDELEYFFAEAKTNRGKAVLREKLKMQIRAGFAQEVHQRTIVPTASTDPKSLFQLRAGTAIGEIGLAMAQFKSYPIAVWQKLIAPAMANNKSALAAYYAFAIPTGMLSLTIKDIIKGETPRPFFNLDGEHDWDVVARNWAGLFFAVSGVPVFDRILSQFLTGELKDKGQAIADLAGPTAGYIFDRIVDLGNIGKGLVTGESEKAAKGATKMALSLPVISPVLHGNIFGATIRNIIDHNLLEAASPGYIDSLENIAEKQGKSYYNFVTSGSDFANDLKEKGAIR